jgi:hypothetical protein
MINELNKIWNWYTYKYHTDSSLMINICDMISPVLPISGGYFSPAFPIFSSSSTSVTLPTPSPHNIMCIVQCSIHSYIWIHICQVHQHDKWIYLTSPTILQRNNTKSHFHSTTIYVLFSSISTLFGWYFVRFNRHSTCITSPSLWSHDTCLHIIQCYSSYITNSSPILIYIYIYIKWIPSKNKSIQYQTCTTNINSHLQHRHNQCRNYQQLLSTSTSTSTSTLTTVVKELDTRSRTIQHYTTKSIYIYIYIYLSFWKLGFFFFFFFVLFSFFLLRSWVAIVSM